MKHKEETKIRPMSIAKMVSLHDSTPVVLPPEFVDILTGNAKSAVLILKPYSPIIRLIPAQNPLGVKVVIETSESFSNVFREIGQVFSRNKLKFLYCTGLCMAQETCTYEGFFDFNKSPISEDQLKEEITNLKGVDQVEFFKLQTESRL
jgi:hypothetical protein